MGTDKALQLYDKKPFIKHVLDALQPIKTKITIVSSKKIHQNLGYSFIPDVQINKGPLSGILSSLKDSKTNWNLILSCDIPLLKTNFITWLIANHNTNYEATVCLVNGKKMPLTAIYHKSCTKIFNSYLCNDKLRVMSVLGELKVNYVEVPKDLHIQLTNVNTPYELKALSL